MRKKKLIIIFSVICVLTLLIVLNSAVFSVQHIDAYCYNVDDIGLEQQVVANTGLKKGRSIFTVKEDKVISSVEAAVGNVRVVNIERKFPNRVCVNYVKIIPYFEFYSGGKYYLCSNDARILEINDVACDPSKAVTLRADATVTGTQNNATLFAESSRETAVVSEIFLSLSRLGYYDATVELIDWIDIRALDTVYMRMSSGVGVKIVGVDGMFEKLRYAMSYYNEADDLHRNAGTIIVTSGQKSYSPNDLYAEEMGN